MPLETSRQLLERLRAKTGASWYGLAGLLSTHKNTVYNWKGGHTVVDRRFAPRIAELLEESPAYVLACLEAEREQDASVRKVWKSIADAFRSNAASVLLSTVAVLGLSALPSQEVGAAPASGGPSNTCYVTLKRWLRRLFGLQNLDRRSVTAPAF